MPVTYLHIICHIEWKSLRGNLDKTFVDTEFYAQNEKKPSINEITVRIDNAFDGDDSIVELKVLRCICHLSSFIYHIHCEILMLMRIQSIAMDRFTIFTYRKSEFLSLIFHGVVLLRNGCRQRPTLLA